VLGAMDEKGGHMRQNVSVITLTRDVESLSQTLKVSVLLINMKKAKTIS
jgi:hypothetical protein